MDSFDFTPLFRSTIGYDRLLRLADAATRFDGASTSYPPYNIEATGENAYRLTMAVAGFGRDDIEITVKENELLVSGKSKKDEEQNAAYLHRGIARRAFERRFQLADHIKVIGRFPRQRPVARRADARSARGEEAAQDRDRHGSGASGAKTIDHKAA